MRKGQSYDQFISLRVFDDKLIIKDLIALDKRAAEIVSIPLSVHASKSTGLSTPGQLWGPQPVY